MLSRRKDQQSQRGASSSKTGESDDRLGTSSSSSSSTRGEKRKALASDRHDEYSSEYLRRKHNFIKSTIRTDYQPDICKDYKETGFCGFGDSCKFLHDRSDYKHGWQIDQEYAKGLYKEEDDDKYLIKDDEEDDNDGIPPECVICNEPYKDPIVTKCKHFFCGNCAEKECSDKCFSCDKATSGIFKVAKIECNKNKEREMKDLEQPTEVEEKTKSKDHEELSGNETDNSSDY